MRRTESCERDLRTFMPSEFVWEEVAPSQIKLQKDVNFLRQFWAVPYDIGPVYELQGYRCNV